MTRIFATAAILICFSFSIACPAYSEQQRNLASDNGCFPWQDFRDGKCVNKQSPTSPPPLPEQPAPSPALSPPSLAPPPASPSSEMITRRPEIAVTCDGGTIDNGVCTCPSGYRVMLASGNQAGGTCVKTNAENCLGGELTVNGQCLCNGQVTMSGETYLLEYSRGKCLPMRCPVSELKDGKCTTAPTLQSTEVEPKPRPAAKNEPAAPRRCGRGMVHTKSGCVARRRDWDFYDNTYRYY